MKAACTPLAAAWRSTSGLAAGRRAHEDQVGGAVGDLVDRAEGGTPEDVDAFAVGGEDLALVAVGEDVVEGDEAELAGVGRGAGHDDAAWVEQRPEVVLGGHQRCSEGLGQLDQGVDRDRPPSTIIRGFRSTEHRPGIALGGVRQRQQHGGQRVAVDRRLAAERPEQGLGGEVVDHLVGVDLADRHQAHDDVGHGLGEDAADPEHHGGPELGIAVEPGDELAGGPQHRGDEHLDRAVVGAGGREQLGGGVAARVGVGQAEPDQAPLGLVGDGVTAELGDHRDRRSPRPRPGLVGGVDELLGEERDAERREQRLGVGFGEGVGHGSRAARKNDRRCSRRASRTSASSGSASSRPSMNGRSEK